MLKPLHSIARGVIWLFAAALSLLVFGLNIFYHASIVYTHEEIITITSRLVPSVLMLLVIAGLLALVARYERKLEKINQNHLFLLFSAIYLLLALWLIRPDYYPLADAQKVFDHAVEVKREDFAAFQPGNYLSVYPHQLGMLTYDLLLSLVVQSPRFNCAVNLLLVLGINALTWKISMELTQDKLVHLLTLILSFIFLPQLFFILFMYGQIPGLFFLLGAYWLALRFCRTHDWLSGAGVAVCTVLSVLLRQNYLIGGIAIIFYVLIAFCRKPHYRKAVLCAAVAICMVVPNQLLCKIYEAKTDTNLQNGCPSILFVAMGTNLDNRGRAAGWYDGSNIGTYLYEAQGQAEVASQIGMQRVKQNMERIVQNPAQAFDFFKEKVISTWCEPLYQSLWSCSMVREKKGDYPPLLYSLYAGETAETVAQYLCAFVSLLVWLGACVFLLTGSKNTSGWMLMFLFFIGGFLFHLVWETKSQYVYPYVFGLIPFAAMGLRRLAAAVSHVFSFGKNDKLRLPSIGKHGRIVLSDRF